MIKVSLLCFVFDMTWLKAVTATQQLDHTVLYRNSPSSSCQHAKYQTNTQAWWAIVLFQLHLKMVFIRMPIKYNVIISKYLERLILWQNMIHFKNTHLSLLFEWKTSLFVCRFMYDTIRLFTHACNDLTGTCWTSPHPRQFYITPTCKISQFWGISVKLRKVKKIYMAKNPKS